MKHLLVPLALVPTFFLGSCSMGGCTADYCFDRAVILVRAGNWVAGLYRFEGTLDGRSFTCEMELPWTEASLPPLCDVEGIVLGPPAFGDLPPPGGEAMIDVQDRDPRQVELRVSRDETEIAAQTVVLAYERVTAGCDQVCRQGEAVVALP